MKSRVDDREFILHTQMPRFLAEVMPQKGEIQLVNELAERFIYGARTNRIGDTYYIISIIEIFDEDFDPSEMPKLMSRMGDWYYSVIKERSQDEHH